VVQLIRSASKKQGATQKQAPILWLILAVKRAEDYRTSALFT